MANIDVEDKADREAGAPTEAQIRDKFAKGKDTNLPLHLRNKIVQSLTGKNQTNFAAILQDLYARELGEAYRGYVTVGLISESMGAARVSTKGTRVCLNYVNWQIRRPLGLPDISEGAYRRQSFKGETAVSDFIAWLKHLPDQTSLLPAPVLDALPDAWAPTLKAVEAFLNGESEKRLLVIKGDREARGQFSRFIVQALQAKTQHQPIFYAPVGRPSAALPRAYHDLLPAADRQRLFEQAGVHKPKLARSVFNDLDKETQAKLRELIGEGADRIILPPEAIEAIEAIEASEKDEALLPRDEKKSVRTSFTPDEFKALSEKVRNWVWSEGDHIPLPFEAYDVLPGAIKDRLWRDSTETGPRMTAPLLVGLLHAFLDMNGAEETLIPADAQEMSHALLKIRRALALNPSILIFDGYSAMGKSLSTLRAFQLGDPLFQVLPHLLEDWCGKPAFCPVPSRTEEVTRVIVLSDSDAPELALHPHDSIDLGALPTKPAFKLFFNSTRPQIVARTISTSEHAVEQRREPTHADIEAVLERAPGREFGEDMFALVETQLRLGFWANGAPANGDQLLNASFDEAMSSFLDRLEQTHPLALFVLRLAAASPGGVRYVTLWNLLNQWAQSCHDAPEHLKLESAPAVARLMKLAAQLQPLLLDVQDDPLEGADDSVRQEAYLDPPRKPAQTGRARLRMIDIRSRRVREIVVRHLYSNEDPVAVARMHRLMAEECLRQHTVAQRHRSVDAVVGANGVQRICQALFHGWTSLACGPAKQDNALKPVARVLPLNPTKIYVRLYAIFYRLIMEAPPHWEIARVHGFESLKSDLLYVACNIDHIGTERRNDLYDRNATIAPRVTAFLRPGRTGEGRYQLPDDQKQRIAREQLLHLARALYYQGRIDDAALACDAVNDQNRGEDLAKAEYGEGEQIIAMIRRLRLELTRHKGSADRSQVEGVFIDIMPSESKGIAAIGDVLTQVTAETSPEGARATLERASNTEALDLIRDANASKLHLRANFWAIYADTVWTAVSRQPHTEPRELLRAFIAFRIAEHVRRHAFDRAPLGPYVVADSHHLRSFARVALAMVASLKNPDVAGELNSLPPPQYFRREARRQADILTRYYGRYASERASMHMLESEFYDLGKPEDVSRAIECLDEAEHWMVSTAERPRIRMRLLYTRARLVRAWAAQAPPDDAARLHRCADADMARLGRYAAHFKDRFWQNLARPTP